MMKRKMIWTLVSAVGLGGGIGLVSQGCSSSDSTPAPATGGLYDRLGGHAGIRTAIDAIVAKELMDPEIASFFGSVGQPGHPTADHIEECFTNLLGKAAGGSEQYPSMANGFACRDMHTIHAPLHIAGATFDKFVTIAAGVLKSAGVADTDITTIGGVLNGTKTDIVDPGASLDAGTTSDADSTEGGGSDGALPANLYGRLGGHSGIRTAIDAIVGKELMDPEIVVFFGNVGKPGHPTADQIEECFTDLLGKAAGGPEQYPTMASGFTCRDMHTIHAPLHIPGATFDKFVTIAAGVLKGAGVADDDITTIGGVLNGTKTDIVEPAAVSDAGTD